MWQTILGIGKKCKPEKVISCGDSCYRVIESSTVSGKDFEPFLGDGPGSGLRFRWPILKGKISDTPLDRYHSHVPGMRAMGMFAGGWERGFPEMSDRDRRVRSEIINFLAHGRTETQRRADEAAELLSARYYGPYQEKRGWTIFDGLRSEDRTKFRAPRARSSNLMGQRSNRSRLPQPERSILHPYAHLWERDFGGPGVPYWRWAINWDEVLALFSDFFRFPNRIYRGLNNEIRSIRETSLMTHYEVDQLRMMAAKKPEQIKMLQLCYENTGITQEDLAKRLGGVSVKSVYNWTRELHEEMGRLVDAHYPENLGDSWMLDRIYVLSEELGYGRVSPEEAERRAAEPGLQIAEGTGVEIRELDDPLPFLATPGAQENK